MSSTTAAPRMRFDSGASSLPMSSSTLSQRRPSNVVAVALANKIEVVPLFRTAG